MTMVSVAHATLTESNHITSSLAWFVYHLQTLLQTATSNMEITFSIATNDSLPFHSRANLLPGANRPIGPWPVRSLELSLPGVKWPGNEELLHSRVFAPWNFRSPLVRDIICDIHLYSNDMYL